MTERITADLILVNGKVATMNAQARFAEAIAVRDSRVLALGTSAEIAALAGADTEVTTSPGAPRSPASSIHTATRTATRSCC